jgi:hypothetical protein
VIGALAVDGAAAGMSVAAAATGAAVFPAFAEQALTPASRDRPDALVVTDDLPAREAEAVRGALDRAGPGHRSPPPHSPGLAGGGAARAERAGPVEAEGRAARRGRPPARARPRKPPSARPPPRSPPGTPAGGSASPATSPRTEPQSALGWAEAVTQRSSVRAGSCRVTLRSTQPTVTPRKRWLDLSSPGSTGRSGGGDSEAVPRSGS